MRKPRSCPFEANKRDTLILKQLLYVSGTRRWERNLQQDKCLQVSPQTALAWACSVRDGCPDRLRRLAPFTEAMTKRKHVTEQNKEGNKGGRLGLLILINTKIMARGIQWMGVLRLPCFKGNTCSLSD